MASNDDKPDDGGLDDLSETVEKRPDMPEGPRPVRDAADSESIDVDPESLFRESELFRDLTSDEVREIVHVSEVRRFGAGETLFEQGDEADALHIVESGELEVRSLSEFGEEVVLAVLGTGTVVGEMALLEGGPRSATVEALGDCTVFALSREAFRALRESERHSAYKLILNLAQTLGERRRQVDGRIAEVFDDPARHIDEFESHVHEMLGRMKKV